MEGEFSSSFISYISNFKGGSLLNFKKNIALGMAAGLIGMALISGGTFAYFSDTVETNNRVVAGTLDLGIIGTTEEGVIFDFDNKQPGDTFDYFFELKNDGTLDIKDVKLFSNHTVLNKEGQIIENDFGSQIIIKSLMVNDEDIIHEKAGITLDDLQGLEVTMVEGFSVAEVVKVYVNFEFINEENQNEYQGNSLELNWTFEAMQTD